MDPFVVGVVLIVVTATAFGVAIAYHSGGRDWIAQRRRRSYRLELAERMPLQYITRDYLAAESNAEVRAVLLRRIGVEKWAKLLGVTRHQSDDWGAIYQDTFGVFRAVAVLNTTPSEDGTRKEYWLRIPGSRDLQPTRLCHVCGRDLSRDAITSPRQAIAWTFSLCGSHYHPALAS